MPFGGTTFFRIEDTRAFAASDEIYRRGYAEPGKFCYGILEGRELCDPPLSFIIAHE